MVSAQWKSIIFLFLLDFYSLRMVIPCFHHTIRTKQINMELHHKLRRDPSWHPNSCNICGQLGHQAATCSTGTVDWKTIYGPRAFLQKSPVFPSDIDRYIRRKKVNMEELDRDVASFIQVKQRGGDTGDLVMEHSKHMVGHPPPRRPIQQQQQQQQRKIIDEPDLPPGWAAAKDGSGKVYYFHRETKKVQWQKPTE